MLGDCRWGVFVVLGLLSAPLGCVVKPSGGGLGSSTQPIDKSEPERDATKQNEAQRELDARKLEAQKERFELIRRRREEAEARKQSPTPTCATVQFARPCWLRANSGDCHVWNPAPQSGDTIAYGGECRHGRAAGIGFATRSDGTNLIGTFRDGRLVEGTRWIKGGEFRRGRFSDTSFDGMVAAPGGIIFKGVEQYSTGTVRTVSKGIITRPDGSSVEGTFHDGKIHGSKIETLPNGTVMEGAFAADGTPTGVHTVRFFREDFKFQTTYVNGKPTPNDTYLMRSSSGWTTLPKAEWEAKLQQAGGVPLEAWSWKSGSTSVISFRLTGPDARALYAGLALPEKRESHPAPTRTILTAEDKANPLNAMAMWPEWTVKEASTTPVGRDSRFQMQCYRWNRTNPPALLEHDVCRIDIALGKTYQRTRLFYHGNARLLDVEDVKGSLTATTLYSALAGPGASTTYQKSKAVRRSLRPPTVSWELNCYEYRGADGKTPRHSASGPVRTCRFTFVGPTGSQQVPKGTFAGPTK
jgi:hypothetical protein